MRTVFSLFCCFFFISSAVVAESSGTQKIFRSCTSKKADAERLECYEGIFLKSPEEKSDYIQSAKSHLQWCSSKIEAGARIECYDRIAEEVLREPSKEVKSKKEPEQSGLIPTFQDYEKKALRGDYGAQRNVAFCLSNPEECTGRFTSNRIDTCMWRMIILTSGHKDVGASDIMSHKIACQSPKLTNQERYLAVSKAELIFLKIYKRKMPVEVLFQ